MDLDPSRANNIPEVFDSQHLIHGSSSTHGDFRQGVSETEVILDKIMDRIRHMQEKINSSARFEIHHAFGGTGAGVTSRLCQELKDEYPKCENHSTCLTPSENFGRISDSENFVLATSWFVDNVDVSYFFDNDTLFNVCRSQKGITSELTYCDFNQ